MPRFFFHRINGTGARDVDQEGIELDGPEDARNEAIVFASDTLKETKYALWDGGEVQVEVADASNIVIFLILLRAQKEFAAQSTC